MPIRYIEVPSPIALIDPPTGKPIVDPVGVPIVVKFSELVTRLMVHPLWTETVQAAKAQQDIYRELDAATKEGGSGVMMISDEDWQKLKTSAEAPRGLGVYSTVVSQLLPMLSAITEAKTEKPKRLVDLDAKAS